MITLRIFSFQLLTMRSVFISTMATTVMIIAAGFYSFNTQTSLTGAWNAKNGSIEHVLIIQDGYFSHSIFDKKNKKFIRTWGGNFSESGGQIHANIEFDTESKDNVGGHRHFAGTVNGNILNLDLGSGISSWTKIDEGNTNLAGNWRITGRANNGQMQQMERGARKTLKILSSTRFQWMAINPETKEFSGTGGGTYTFKKGKYTEHIEFFSRDSTRVGASLKFDGSVNNNIWTHKGLNSRGEPIHEEWTREK